MARPLICSDCKDVYLSKIDGIFGTANAAATISIDFMTTICPDCKKISIYAENFDYENQSIPFYEHRLNAFQKEAFRCNAKLYQDDRFLKKRYSKTNLFESNKIELSNILEWEADLLEYKIHVLDYKLKVNLGTAFQTAEYAESHTIIAIDSKKLALTEMKIVPREELDKKMGHEFPDKPKFDELFNITGKNESHIRATLDDDDLVQFFVENPEFTFECENYFAFFYYKYRLVQPEKIEEYYEKGKKLMNLLIKATS